MDDSSLGSLDHPISDLVGAFLDAAQAVVATLDPAHSDVRPAELSYELDQVVSNYLEQHQLSSQNFDAIQQDVVNSIAEHFNHDGSYHAPMIQFDEHGNAGLRDVITLLDHHYAYELQHDHFTDAAGLMPDFHGHIDVC